MVMGVGGWCWGAGEGEASRAEYLVGVYSPCVNSIPSISSAQSPIASSLCPVWCSDGTTGVSLSSLIMLYAMLCVYLSGGGTSIYCHC